MNKPNRQVLLATAKETMNILTTRQMSLFARSEGLVAWIEANSATSDEPTLMAHHLELREITKQIKQLHREWHEFAEWLAENLPEVHIPEHECQLD